MAFWPYLAMHLRTALWVASIVACVVVIAWRLGASFRALRHPIVDRILMPLIVFGYGVMYLRSGEKVSHQGGYGWDGIRFGAWAKNFHKAVLVDRVNHYYLQKSLPSAVVHYGMRAVDAPFTDANVILAFGILDVFSWTVTAILWTRIAKLLGLSRAAAWLGFVVVFVNHAAMKHYLYNAVLVDSMGLLLAALMFHAHLARRPWLIVPLAFAGGFTIPGVLPLLGGLLVLFDRGELRTVERPKLGTGLAFAGAFAVAYAAWGIWDLGYWIGNGSEQVIAGLVPISLLSLWLFLGMLCAPLLSHWPALRDLGRAFRLRWVFAFAAIVFAIGQVVEHYKNTVTDVTADAHYRTVLLLAIAKPLVSLVAHTAFLGPCLLLCLVLRKELGRAMWKLGPSMVLVAAVGFVLATDSESRHILFFLPAFAAGLAIAFDAIGGASRAGVVLVVAIVSIVLSKAWLPHETPPLGPNLDERLFMSLGPWMTLPAYGIQGAATIASGILFQRGLRRFSSLPS